MGELILNSDEQFRRGCRLKIFLILHVALVAILFNGAEAFVHFWWNFIVRLF